LLLLDHFDSNRSSVNGNRKLTTDYCSPVTAYRLWAGCSRLSLITKGLQVRVLPFPY